MASLAKAIWKAPAEIPKPPVEHSKSSVEIPDDYICPISMEIMKDPVICEDGYTYDRKTIESLPNSLSPMTRQSIDRSKLIPNRNLKNLIDSFVKLNGLSVGKLPSNNAVSKKSGSDDLIGVMMSERMGALERFEYEQRQKEIARREQINKEKMEKERKLKEEQELDKMIDRVCAYFNSKDVPSFYIYKFPGINKIREKIKKNSVRCNCSQNQSYPAGMRGFPGAGFPGIQNKSVKCNCSLFSQKREENIIKLVKYSFVPSILKKIKKINIDRLFEIYKKISEDNLQKIKYVPTNNEHEFKNKEFVDFCFDFYIDKIDELIEKYKIKPISETQIKNKDICKECVTCGTVVNVKYMVGGGRYREQLLPCDICKNTEFNIINTHMIKKRIILKELELLKKTIVNPREYYYVNKDEIPLKFKPLIEKYIKFLLDYFREYITSEFAQNFSDKKGDESLGFTQSFRDCLPFGVKLGGSVPSSMKYSHYFGNIFKIHTKCLTDVKNKNYSTLLDKDLYTSDISSYPKIEDVLPDYFEKNIHNKCLTSEDFTPIIKLGKLFIELIEFLRPEIIIKYNEESIRTTSEKKIEWEYCESSDDSDEEKPIKKECGHIVKVPDDSNESDEGQPNQCTMQ